MPQSGGVREVCAPSITIWQPNMVTESETMKYDKNLLEEAGKEDNASSSKRLNLRNEDLRISTDLKSWTTLNGNGEAKSRGCVTHGGHIE